MNRLLHKGRLACSVLDQGVAAATTTTTQACLALEEDRLRWLRFGRHVLRSCHQIQNVWRNRGASH